MDTTEIIRRTIDFIQTTAAVFLGSYIGVRLMRREVRDIFKNVNKALKKFGVTTDEE